MAKILKTVMDIARNIAKMFFPSILVSNVIKRGLDLKTFSMSMVAQYSRRFGARAILTVGVLATVYASYLYMTSIFTPDLPKASHDVILKTRFSSPKPSDKIIIVDIDERTLAALSEKHGRWPWSRDVLADGLQKFNELGTRAVLFNVLFSDPDKNNPDADAVMDVTAQINRAVSFPLIRLNPKNDDQSQLKVAQIPGVQLKAGHLADSTIAVILPMFGSMHDRLGVANQMPDADGIVRKYPLRWEEATFLLPSMVQRTADLATVDIAKAPNVISLNWRNKQGRYNRISYSDVFLDKIKPEQTQAFKDAFVVLSLSAPGLGQTKPTSVASVEDDGEILATALDDALHQTYLRNPHAAVYFLINLLTIWVLVWMTLKQITGGFMTNVFVILEFVLGGITLLSASYTHYLIDLSDTMSFGLGVFSTIKLVQSMDDRWSRARPGFRKPSQSQIRGQLLLLSFLDHRVTANQRNALQNAVERIVGMPNVVRVDDLFGGESFIKSECAHFMALLVNVAENKTQAMQSLLAHADYTEVDVATYDMTNMWDPGNKDFTLEVAPLILASATRLLHDEWAARA